MSVHRHDMGTWVACVEGDVYYCATEEEAREQEQELLARRRCSCGCPTELWEDRCWYCEQRRNT